MLPLPEITDENRHFWQGGRDDKLIFTYCAPCDYIIHPPAPVCPCCLNREPGVRAVSGRATVASITINYQQWLPDMEVPYVLAIVELMEQKAVRLTTRIITDDVHSVFIGMPVKVVFEQRGEVWLPLFEADPGSNASGES